MRKGTACHTVSNLILCTVTNAMLQLVTFVQQALLFATFFSLQTHIYKSSCHYNELPPQVDIEALTDTRPLLLHTLQHILILAAAGTADYATGQALACEHSWQNLTCKVCISTLTTLYQLRLIRYTGS